MRHDWIFDVLSDLQAYAERNGLPDLALNLAATMIEARHEVALSGLSVETNDPLDDDGHGFPLPGRVRTAH